MFDTDFFMQIVSNDALLSLINTAEVDFVSGESCVFLLFHTTLNYSCIQKVLKAFINVCYLCDLHCSNVNLFNVSLLAPEC